MLKIEDLYSTKEINMKIQINTIIKCLLLIIMLERVDGWDVINKYKYYSNRYFINYISIQEQNGYF